MIYAGMVEKVKMSKCIIDRKLFGQYNFFFSRYTDVFFQTATHMISSDFSVCSNVLYKI